MEYCPNLQKSFGSVDILAPTRENLWAQALRQGFNTHPGENRKGEPSSVQRQSSSVYVHFAALVATAGGFLFGYDLAVVAGAIIFLKKAFNLNPVELGFAIGSAQIGCMIAPFIAGPLSDRWGRKRSLFTAGILFGASAIGTALPRNMIEFNTFRIVAGLGIGMASVVVPMYIAEISPPHNRGRLVSLNQFCIVIGAMTSFAVAYYFSFGGRWRLMFASAVLPSIAFLAGLVYVPESPRWLAQQNRFDEARDILTKIDGAESAESEIKAIALTLRAESGGWSELFRPGIRIALLVGTALCFLQGWSGGTAINYYAPMIFQQGGFSRPSDAILLTLLMNVTSLICTVTTLLLVDRVGRRPLLLLGMGGMAVGLGFLGLSLYTGHSGFPTVASLFLSNVFYQISIAPLAWMILSEIFPLRVRAKGQALGTFAVWISTYTSNQFLGPLMNYFERVFGSGAGAFWIFAGVCVLILLFSYKMVPETKGRTLEEIARFWTPQQGLGA